MRKIFLLLIPIFISGCTTNNTPPAAKTDMGPEKMTGICWQCTCHGQKPIYKKVDGVTVSKRESGADMLCDISCPDLNNATIKKVADRYCDL